MGDAVCNRRLAMISTGESWEVEATWDHAKVEPPNIAGFTSNGTKAQFALRHNDRLRSFSGIIFHHSQGTPLTTSNKDTMSITTFSSAPVPKQQPQRTSQPEFIAPQRIFSTAVKWTPKMIAWAEKRLKFQRLIQEERRYDWNGRNEPEDSLKYRRQSTPKATYLHLKPLRAEAEGGRVWKKKPSIPPPQPSQPLMFTHLWRNKRIGGFRWDILTELERRGGLFLPEIHRGTEESQLRVYQPPDEDDEEDDDEDDDEEAEEDGEEHGGEHHEEDHEDNEEDEMEIDSCEDRREDEMDIVPSDASKDCGTELIPNDDPMWNLAQVCAMEQNAICKGLDTCLSKPL
ncbi:MAG: hypothetical protein Q9212_002617 [Teloschistes hypoglaucus]